MNDRIKLAEAMGWKRINHEDMAWWPAPYVIERIKKEHPEVIAFDYVGLDQLPDPENDANDDYAVLEWARERWRGETLASFWKDKEQWTAFVFRLNLTWMDDGENYKIGDYARALLKYNGG